MSKFLKSALLENKENCLSLVKTKKSMPCLKSLRFAEKINGLLEKKDKASKKDSLLWRTFYAILSRKDWKLKPSHYGWNESQLYYKKNAG